MEDMFPLCPFSAYGSVLFHPEPRLIFQQKFHWEQGAINCFKCNVKHELPNFHVHLMLTNLTLV